MVTIDNILKEFNGTKAVEIPQLTIPQGESFGLVGNNGAGKTTLFRMVLDLLQPTRGTIELNGANVKGNEDWKSITGSYLDEGFLIDFLTPEEYFNFVAGLHGIAKPDLQEKLQQYDEFFHGEILGQKKYIRDLSKGNQKKVGITAALLSEPQIAILDEPFANLDPSTQIRLKSILKDLKENKNVTMVISSHDLNHVTEVCERIVVLEKGDIVHDIQTKPETLKELESYFAI